MDDFFDRWGSDSDAVRNASDTEQKWLLFFHRTMDETMDHIERVQTSLVGQYIPDYTPDDDTALNYVLSEGISKLRDQILFIAVSCLEPSEDEQFPDNFFTSIRDIASDVGDETLSAEGVEEIRRLHELPSEGMSMAIPQGASDIEEQLNSLLIRDFSRRMDREVDKKPALAAVEL